MATNDFLPFATAGGANVLAQSDWLALAARLSGYTAGVANSSQINKGLRQSAAVAAMIGQFINDYGGLDALDDGNIANLVRDFTRSIQAGKFAYAVATGTANAWVVAPTPALAAYAAGRVLNIIAPATNTSTTVNMNVSGLGNRQIKKADGSDPAIGDLVSGRVYATIDDGANVRILTPLPSDIIVASPSAGRTQVFTASGTFIVPATQVEVWAVGGGGAAGCSGDGAGGGISGNPGAGGGAGAFGYKRISGLTVGASIAVTIGAGGTPSTSNPSGPGGSTSFGSYLTCAGGLGGAYGSSSGGPGGLGGVATGADISVPGGQGGFSGPNTGSVSPSDVIRIYSRGGQVGGGWGTVKWGGTGDAGQGYGSGGTGASGGSLLLGGAGAAGLLIVRW